MDGIFRMDEWKRFRSLIPSDRALLELNAGWTSSLQESKRNDRRFSLSKRECRSRRFATTCTPRRFMFTGYYMIWWQAESRASSARRRQARPRWKCPWTRPTPAPDPLATARSYIAKGAAEDAVSTVQILLAEEPKNNVARTLLDQAEDLLLMQMYSPPLLPDAVPRLLMNDVGLTSQSLAPQEAFVLSRINNEWDVKSILSICPFREIDCVRMIKGLLIAASLVSKRRPPQPNTN